MGRAAAKVDVHPVGLGRRDRHVGAQPAKDLGRGLEGGAVGAVEEYAPASQIELAESRLELVQVVLERALEWADAADVRGWRRGRVELGLDRVLGVVMELEA